MQPPAPSAFTLLRLSQGEEEGKPSLFGGLPAALGLGGDAAAAAAVSKQGVGVMAGACHCVPMPCGPGGGWGSPLFPHLSYSRETAAVRWYGYA